MTHTHVRYGSRIIFSAFFAMLIIYILLYSFSPLGFTLTRTPPKDVSNIGPADRVYMYDIAGDEIQELRGEITYFTTKATRGFDTATVLMTFQNPDPEQKLHVGFRDQEVWHYHSEPVDMPMLDSLGWIRRTGNGFSLYQRTNEYSSIGSFFSNPPNVPVGTMFYTPDLTQFRIPSYTPSKTPTIIDTPLRGKHIMYAYLQDEPFSMTIEKQDLNWVEGEDPLTIKIYLGQELVYEQTLEDDGVIDGSKNESTIQTVTARNPGEEYPQTGIYTIVLDTSSDTIIRKISTNLHRFVLQSPIFLAGNDEAYPLLKGTNSTTLVTNSKEISAKTSHTAGLQTINIGNDTLVLKEMNTEEKAIIPDSLSALYIPKNDVILQGSGYFGFSAEQFFVPSEFLFPFTIRTKEDIANVNYIIISDYAPPVMNGPWKTITKTFQLSSAVFTNDELNWIIQAPKLKEHQGVVTIKNIQVKLYKKPSVKLPWNISN